MRQPLPALCALLAAGALLLLGGSAPLFAACDTVTMTANGTTPLYNVESIPGPPQAWLKVVTPGSVTVAVQVNLYGGRVTSDGALLTVNRPVTMLAMLNAVTTFAGDESAVSTAAMEAVLTGCTNCSVIVQLCKGDLP